MNLISIILPVVLAMISQPEAQSRLDRYEFARNHMGTRFRIVLYADRSKTANEAAQAAFVRVEELNSRFSDYRDDSELNELCRSAARGPVRVRDDLFQVLSLSREWSELTGGAFDITAAPAVRLWRRARRTGELPDSNQLRKARELVGYRNWSLDHNTRSIRLDKPGMQLDLGGIAKGFAADEALAALARFGIDRALVAAGGDVVVGEAPPDSQGWVVAVSPFADSTRPPLTRLVLRNSAVSTSGDAEQFVEIGGVRYSHIVDPRTGMALTGTGSVTVVARKGAISDPAATALSVLGPDEGLRLVDSSFRRFGRLSALFTEIRDGVVRRRESRDWKIMMKYE